MKSRQRSYGKNCLILVLFFTSCTVVRQSEQTEGQAEISLTSDQQTIEELRKNIPEEKRVENDALKELLKLTGEVKEPPHRVREKFYRITQRMRQDFQRDSQRKREEYNRKEKHERDEVFDKMKKERDEFNEDKNSREARSRFYDDQDRKRREFTADQREARERFNADMKQKQDDFSAMMRDKQTEFTAEMRNYTERYNETKKLEEARRRNDNVNQLNQAPDATSVEPLTSGGQ